MVNVDFEWFDPQPAVDFHGLKTLLRQLLDVDAQLFNLSELTDLILSQPTLGSTVKVDGNETDPYAFLTVLNLQTHKVHLHHALHICQLAANIHYRIRKSYKT
jgi:protein BCP1